MSGVEFAAHAAVSHISTELGLRGQAIAVGIRPARPALMPCNGECLKSSKVAPT